MKVNRLEITFPVFEAGKHRPSDLIKECWILHSIIIGILLLLESIVRYTLYESPLSPGFVVSHRK